MSRTGEDRHKLGERLKASREYLGLSQEEVAKSIGIPRSALSAIELGQRGIDALELKALAKVYGVSVGYLTGETTVNPDLLSDVAHLARAVKKLNQSDRDELNRFAEYLAARGKAKKKKSDE